MADAPSHARRRAPALALALAAAGCSAGGGSDVPVTMSLTAAAITSTEIRLEWPGVSGAFRYDVYAGGTFLFDTQEAHATVGALRPRSTTCFTVYAEVFLLGVTGRSNTACATTPGDTPPSTPDGLVAAALSPLLVELSWRPAADDWGISAYEVARDGAALGSAPATSFSDAGVLPGTTHCYTVVAVDTAGARSPASAPTCATTPADAGPPSTPGLTTTAEGTTTVTLRWSAVADDSAVAAYRVYREGALLRSVAANTSGDAYGYATQDPGLSPYTQYCYQLTAVDVVGNESAPSPRACVTTSWRRAVLVPGDVFVDSGGHNAAALDAAGALHVAYTSQAWQPDTRTYGPLALYHGTYQAGAWSSSAVAASVGWGAVGIALDGAGGAHVSYCDTGYTPNHASAANGWVAERVETRSCYDTSLAFAPGGDALLAFASIDGVRLAIGEGGTWSSVVAAVSAGQPSLALAPDGSRRLAYHDAQADALGLASDASGAWVSSAPDPRTGAGQYPAVAVDPAGHVHLAHLDAASGRIRYATDASGGWAAVDVDAGTNPALAVDGAGAAHLAYLSVEPAIGTAALKYATNASGAFATYVIDAAAAFGANGVPDTSIAVAPERSVHIVYDGGRDGLRYATNR
jgi:chitodextrinase